MAREKITLDENPWMEDGEILHLRYSDWIEKYNARNKVMAGLPDYFALARYGDDKVLRSVQRDMTESVVLAGPIIEYNTESCDKESKIIHYDGISVVKPKERKAVIPDYSDWVRLEIVLNNDIGLNFFQKRLDTRAGKKTIIEAMERLSDRKVNGIYVWTPDLNNRRESPKKAASLGYSSNAQFLIYCGDVDDDGCSRAVKGVKRLLSAEDAIKGAV